MSETGRPPGVVTVDLPRTIGAIKAALPPDEAAEFAALAESTEVAQLPHVAEHWWRRAVMASSGVARIPLSGQPGSAPSVAAEQLFPGYADMLASRRAAA